MSGIDWIVIAAGLAAIAWVNWYFFAAVRKAQRAVAGSSGVQEVTVSVKGGYEPAVIRVRHGQPVRLRFNRQETSGCSEEVVFGDFGIRKFLPAFETTTIELTPDEPGSYDFTCGMGMLHGKLIAE